MSTAELAKEPGKALPTLHHLPDGEQAQRSNSPLSSSSSALKPLTSPSAVPFWALLVAREVIYNGQGDAVPGPSPSQGTAVLHVACSGAATPHLLQRVTAQCCANVGPALALTASAQGLQTLHSGCSPSCCQVYFHKFPSAAPKLLGTCDGSTVSTLTVPFQQHLLGKFLLCQLPLHPNSDSQSPGPGRRQAQHLGSGGARSDLKSRTNLHPCICHGEPNATEGGGSIS